MRSSSWQPAAINNRRTTYLYHKPSCVLFTINEPIAPIMKSIIQMVRSFAVLGVAMVALGGAPAVAEKYDTAVLQTLDKVTARVSIYDAPIGQTVRFGTLAIIARVCDKKPPEETPESAAFLDIWEVRPGEPTASVYRGWMFASSPALAAMEHPVYDVWVVDCKSSSIEAAPSKSE